jgi:capsular polysaccharide transport system permease protein
MNMHGFMTPADQAEERDISAVERVRGWLWARRWFVGIVLIPSLVVALYLFAYASDQYESEAHFLVHSSSTPQVSTSGASAALSLLTGGGAAQNEAMSVADYLTSHDAVDALRSRDHLVERFRRPGVDILSRLFPAEPTPERLLRYYQKQVHVKYNTETGITVVTVHSFTPQDSYDIAHRLMEIGEQRVNEMNARSYNDAIANSRRALAEAENAITLSDAQMTAFRRTRGDIDPQASGQAQLTLVTGLQAELAKARAQLAAMNGVISPSSPQYQALSGHVRALQAQVDAQAGRLVGSGSAIANDISGYQALMLRRDFLSKRYEAAAAGFEKAREQALQQQLYLVRVVNPNMPVKATFPQRGRILGTVLVALLLIYSIGWLIVAGVREHAAN